MPFPWFLKRKRSDDRGSLDRRSALTRAESVRSSSRTSQNRGRSSGGRNAEGRGGRARRTPVHDEQEATDTEELDGESVLSRGERLTQTPTKTRRRISRRRSEEAPRTLHHNGHEFLRSATNCQIGNITINNGIGNEESRRSESTVFIYSRRHFGLSGFSYYRRRKAGAVKSP